MFSASRKAASGSEDVHFLECLAFRWQRSASEQFGLMLALV